MSVRIHQENGGDEKSVSFDRATLVLGPGAKRCTSRPTPSKRKPQQPAITDRRRAGFDAEPRRLRHVPWHRRLLRNGMKAPHDSSWLTARALLP
ncbi:hypothetical protein RCO27_15070 [Sphingosinicella sp. LHD-64]|uniref:hypothetical protein n=1 Tax=Sphingosinicella sp. LHD-64 TaxID=3072139 RepID=UPI00280FA58C|nr:hypothetical protein [Sphingosinicella sp. LHD-64]MDQ8757549.1 hypothetical protein [Sphingosinicella sp. LHD-64]